MPNIKTYDAPTNVPKPTEIGIEATTQAARRAGLFFNQVAGATKEVGDERARMLGRDITAAGEVAVDYAQHREISHGAAAFAGLTDALTQQWNDTAKGADPNDPTVAAKFRETVLEPNLQKFGESFLTEGGRKWAEHRVEALRNHMFEKTGADMGSLAGDAAIVNSKQLANMASNTAMRDPSSVKFLLDSVDSSTDAIVASSPNLKGAVAGRVRMQIAESTKKAIVEAGAIGAIQKSTNPEVEAEKWAAAYPQYINGAEYKTLAANARQQIRAQRQDREYSDHIAKQENEDVSDAVETKYLQKLHSDDPTQMSQVTSKAIVNDPSLTRVAKERMLNVVNREMKPETDARISARTSVDLWRKIKDPDADPLQIKQAIFEARAKDPGTPGSLTKADMTDALKQLEDIKTPQGAALTADRNEFFKRYAGTIDGYLAQQGLHSALGNQKMYDAEKEARRQEGFLKQQGKDPHSLYDPSSPNFFGRPENLSKFQVSMDAAMKYALTVGTQKNLTGPNTTITGIKTEDIKFNPPSNWQFSASRGQFRNPDTGELFDLNGKPVKK